MWGSRYPHQSPEVGETQPCRVKVNPGWAKDLGPLGLGQYVADPLEWSMNQQTLGDLANKPNS